MAFLSPNGMLNGSADSCFSSNNCNCWQLPLMKKGIAQNFNSLAPWVRLDFTSSNKATSTITMGNQSSTDTQNMASIKSFTYGQSDGAGADIEIVDEEGGSFEEFINKITTQPGDLDPTSGKPIGQYTVSVRWGWMLNTCDGSPPQQIGTSTPHTLFLESVDVRIGSGQQITFTIHARDSMEAMFKTRSKGTIEKKTLKNAIIELFSNPNFATPALKPDNILFLRPKQSVVQQCTRPTFDFASEVIQGANLQDLATWDFDGDAATKEQDWPCGDLDPLATARNWMGDYLTDHQKPIIVFWDDTGAAGKANKLVFLESPLPPCWEPDLDTCGNSIGTYIVNGGGFSPVISFDPTIKFDFAASGGDIVAEGDKSVDADIGKGPKCPPAKGAAKLNAGLTVYSQVTPQADAIYGNILSARKINEARTLHERANVNYSPIEADMRIIGDPTLDIPYALRTKTVAIIVLNPFAVRTNVGISGTTAAAACPNWLVMPPCNPVLSNKNWYIQGVSHEIKEGSYTTTLKVRLLGFTST